MDSGIVEKDRAMFAPVPTIRAHYGLISSGSKQIRRILNTGDIPLARRKLQDLRPDIKLTAPELSRCTRNHRSFNPFPLRICCIHFSTLDSRVLDCLGAEK